MSQWGAYGLAKDGWAHKKILTHFYSGTAVKQDPSPPRNLRIGLTQGESKVHLTAEAGPVTIRVDDPKTGTEIGTIPKGKTWTVRVAGDEYRVLNSAGKRVGGKDWGGTARDLFVTYDGARVRSAAAGATYNRGFIEFNLYSCAGSCAMRMILVIAPEAYLLGLGEVPSSWPMAALRAQAVAARSYALNKVESGQHRAGCNCGLYDSSLDQVYIGWAKEGGSQGDRWVRAVQPDRRPDRGVLRRRDPGLLHLLRRRSHREQRERLGRNAPAVSAGASAIPATTPRRTRARCGRSRTRRGR